MLRDLLSAAVIAAALLVGTPAASAPAPDLILTGTISGADHETYREVPFQVPAGVASVTVEFEYTGREQRSVIDLGLRDPQRFRGWSGGNKAAFTVAETWATPSYLPGPLPTGEWRLILGIPNMRQGATAAYKARISFGGPVFQGFAPTALKKGAGWYRGDLHLHTGHSDGSCASREGGRVPCPLFKTLEAAAARGLDFVAVTEHNTTSHHQALAELQPYYTDLLIIPGREITTFKGHLNAFGVVAPLDFQLGGPRAPTVSDIVSQITRAGGLAAINHPGMPSGEACMGCGWTAPVDFRTIAAVEAVNGGSLAQSRGDPEGLLSSLPFWEARLNEGLRITGIGSSDNHDATRVAGDPGAVGTPTTVVYAAELSQTAVLEGLRSGRVFIDVLGVKERFLDVSARAGAAAAYMGGVLKAPAGTRVELEIHVAGAHGGRISLSGPAGAAVRMQEGGALNSDEVRKIEWVSDGRAGWIRVDVRSPEGRLWLIGNPVYIEG